MNHRRSLFVGLGALVVSTVAPKTAAADPSYDAQGQIAFAFQHCDDKDPDGYVKSRDFALTIDPSLRTWNGKVQNKWVSSETIARCDREMPIEAERSKNADAFEKLHSDARLACYASTDRSALEKCRAAIAAYTAKTGKTDPELAAKEVAFRARVEDREKDMAKLEKQNAESAKRDAEAKARLDALKQDRKIIQERRGWPENVDQTKAAKSARWTYTLDIPVNRVERDGNTSLSRVSTARCAIAYDFRGDKLANVKKTGAGCKFDEVKP